LCSILLKYQPNGINLKYFKYNAYPRYFYVSLELKIIIKIKYMCVFGPDRFSHFDLYWTQTNAQTSKTYIYHKELRLSTFKRSGWKCFLVGSTSKTTVPIIFHIFPWKLNWKNIFTHTRRLLLEHGVSHKICPQSKSNHPA